MCARVRVYVKKKKNRFLQCARAAPREGWWPAHCTTGCSSAAAATRAHARAFEIRARARAARFRPLRERGASGVSRFFFSSLLRIHARNIRRGKNERFGLLFLLLLLFRVFFLPFILFFFLRINIGTRRRHETCTQLGGTRPRYWPGPQPF